jgi:hypothetical protein
MAFLLAGIELAAKEPFRIYREVVCLAPASKVPDRPDIRHFHRVVRSFDGVHFAVGRDSSSRQTPGRILLMGSVILIAAEHEMVWKIDRALRPGRETRYNLVHP